MSKAAKRAAEKVAYEARVDAALTEAYAAAAAARAAMLAKQSAARADAHIEDAAGGAALLMFQPSQRLRKALQARNQISRCYKRAWSVGTFHCCASGPSMSASEIACEAAREVLRRHFPEEPDMHIKSFPDNGSDIWQNCFGTS